MKFFKLILFSFFLISVTSSIFGATISHVINNTDKPISVYWTATPCVFVHDHVTEVCHHKVVGSHGGSGLYVFRSLQSNIQVKISADCERNGNHYDNIYSFYCPSTGR